MITLAEFYFILKRPLHYLTGLAKIALKWEYYLTDKIIQVPIKSTHCVEINITEEKKIKF
jgi:hypothetical protein